MARNVSGTYTLPLPDVVTGTVILASWANTTLNDVETEVTDSLSRSGKGGMLAALKLIDGSAASPGLTFSLEPSSGWYRATANDIRLSVAGTDRLNVTASALLTNVVVKASAGFQSDLAAGSANTDFDFNTLNTRTAGNLLTLRNNLTTVVGVSAASILTANVSALVTSQRAAADAGTDFKVTTAATRTAGYLLDIQNAGLTAFRVGFDGVSGLYSTQAAAGTATDLTVNTLNTRTAGALLDVMNGGNSRFKVDFEGKTTHTSGQAAAGGGADFILNTVNLRTAGTLFSVRNQSVNKFVVDFEGKTTQTSGQAAAGTGTDTTLNTTNVRTAGLLLDVQNGGTSRLTVNPDGLLTTGLGLLASGGTNPVRLLIASDVSCSSNTVAVNLGAAISVKSGKTYRFQGRYRSWAAATTTGIGIGIKATGAPTAAPITFDVGVWLTGSSSTTIHASAFSDTPTPSTDSGSTTSAAAMWGVISGCFTATSTGTLQFILISEVNLSAVTVGAGSWLEITED